MKKLSSVFFILILSLVIFTACEDDDDAPAFGNLVLNISGLEDLGSGYQYEGWIMVNGAPLSAGIFSVNSSGNLTKSTFMLDADDLANATAYILTIEPSPDPNPAPSDVHILAGDFSGSSASLTVGHGAALGNDFTSSTGGYILATPTDGGSDTDENSGVWWLDPSAGPGAGLDLPTLPAGWAYEGWAVVDGTPISTGTFTAIDMADDAAPFSGSSAGPPFPGEDLLMNAPSGVTFPTDLAGKMVVISVEPVPDNSPAPFVLKPLVGPVPADATDHTFYMMNINAAATNPTGTASR